MKANGKFFWVHSRVTVAQTICHHVPWSGEPHRVIQLNSAELPFIFLFFLLLLLRCINVITCELEQLKHFFKCLLI